jgi:hypothetical protein
MITGIIYALVALGLLIRLISWARAYRRGGFQVERSARVDAKVEDVFPLLNNLANWYVWSPWETISPSLKKVYEIQNINLDLNIVTTYGGPALGVGAKSSWSGYGSSWKGDMEILESEFQRRIKFKINFKEPSRPNNIGEIHLEPDGAGTLISWKMHGKRNPIPVTWWIYSSMDTQLGDDFERGFGNLKAVLKANINSQLES